MSEKQIVPKALTLHPKQRRLRMLKNVPCKLFFLFATLALSAAASSLPTFNPEGLVWTIENLGYNDHVLYFCYGGQGKTSIPYNTHYTDKYKYDNIEHFVSTFKGLDWTGCATRTILDPSAFVPFMAECDLATDSVFTICKGPQPDGYGFQCGDGDIIMGISERLYPSGPEKDRDRDWTACDDDATCLYRWWFQNNVGLGLYVSDKEVCDFSVWDLGLSCSSGYGEFIFTNQAGFNSFSTEFPCTNLDLSPIHWVCPTDSNYPRSTGCLNNVRALTAGKESEEKVKDIQFKLNMQLSSSFDASVLVETEFGNTANLINDTSTFAIESEQAVAGVDLRLMQYQHDGDQSNEKQQGLTTSETPSSVVDVVSGKVVTNMFLILVTTGMLFY